MALFSFSLDDLEISAYWPLLIPAIVAVALIGDWTIKSFRRWWNNKDRKGQL